MARILEKILDQICIPQEPITEHLSKGNLLDQSWTSWNGQNTVIYGILLMDKILHQLRLVVYPIIYKVLDIPGGCLGFLPSTVCAISTDWFELFINCIFSTFYFSAWQTCIWGICRFCYGPPVARTFTNLPKKHVSCKVFP